MSVVDAIQNLISNLGSYFGILIQRITAFSNSVIDVIGYIISILKAIWFGMISLISGIWDLIVEVLQGGVFVNVNSAFIHLGDYIGGPAVIFIATLLFLIIFRIGVSFIFKILKMNTDYQLKKTEWQNTQSSQRKDAWDKEHNLF